MQRCTVKVCREKSLQRWLSTIRSLFNYLCRFQRASNNPAIGIPAPKSAKRLPKTLNVDELDQLLSIKSSIKKSADVESTEDNALIIRDIAFMELLYGCGLRLSEINGLDLQDIDWQQQTLVVTGKGNKQRQLPFGKKALNALKNWLAKRDNMAKEKENAVFVSQQGNRLSNSSIQKRLKKMAFVQGLNTNVHPHIVAPFIRFTYFRIIKRFTCCAGITGPCKFKYHTNLYAFRFSASGECLR